jgi:hypothetical protein
MSDRATVIAIITLALVCALVVFAWNGVLR